MQSLFEAHHTGSVMGISLMGTDVSVSWALLFGIVIYNCTNLGSMCWCYSEECEEST